MMAMGSCSIALWIRIRPILGGSKIMKSRRKGAKE